MGLSVTISQFRRIESYFLLYRLTHCLVAYTLFPPVNYKMENVCKLRVYLFICQKGLHHHCSHVLYRVSTFGAVPYFSAHLGLD